MKTLRVFTIGLLGLSIVFSLFIVYSDYSMDQIIEGFERRIIASATPFSPLPHKKFKTCRNRFSVIWILRSQTVSQSKNNMSLSKCKACFAAL